MSGAALPKDKSFPSTAGQCDDCGGNGCPTCNGRGWLEAGHPRIRRCARDGCGVAIPPAQWAVYCSSDCAIKDA